MLLDVNANYLVFVIVADFILRKSLVLGRSKE